MKKTWNYFVTLANKKEFLIGYPVFALAAVGLFKPSPLAVILLAVWITAIVAYKDED